MKKIEMLFYKTNPSEKNAGLKFVLFEITDAHGKSVHDWGFCEWNGLEWNYTGIEIPNDFAMKVARWANTVDPQILLKEESKIITLGGR